MKITEKPDGTTIVETGDRSAAAAKSAWDGDSLAGRVLKADDELRTTWHVFYPADKADVSVAADGHRDFASKSAVRAAAHQFLRDHPKVGLWHADGTEGAGSVVESWIEQGADRVWPDGSVTKDGDWCGAIEWDPQTWAKVKEGLVGGVSMQGRAKRRKPAPEAVAALRS